METPLTGPSKRTPQKPNSGPEYRPEEVELCYQAAKKGDLEEVKRLVQQLLHHPRPSSEPLEPHPAWIYRSLNVAIGNQNLDIIRFLLNENVHQGAFPTVEGVVRATAFKVLELFLEYGWDINQPLHRNEPSVLW